MMDHGRGAGAGGSGGKRPTASRGHTANTASPASPASTGSPAVPDPLDRPGASGHRFGPGLVCSECGVRWDAHQRTPQPCTAELPPADPFARRPAPPGRGGDGRKSD